jgi:hypothetical protein
MIEKGRKVMLDDWGDRSREWEKRQWWVEGE